MSLRRPDVAIWKAPKILRIRVGARFPWGTAYRFLCGHAGGAVSMPLSALWTWRTRCSELATMLAWTGWWAFVLWPGIC